VMRPDAGGATGCYFLEARSSIYISVIGSLGALPPSVGVDDVN